MDPHKNIFYYYRTPTRKSEEDFVYDSQIENNTTKSFLNLLEKSTQPIILKTFLELLATKSVDDKLKNVNLKDCKFKLQSIPEAASLLKERYVVIISNKPDVSTESKGTGGGKPDAWIYSPSKSLIFMVEAKLDSPVYRRQIDGHLASCGWKKDVPIVGVRWADIHKAFLKIRNEISSPLDSFLLTEFLQYMEVIGMADFNGFTADDFEFFVNYDPEYKQVIRNKITDFAGLIYKGLPSEIKREYCDIHMGRILNNDERWAWVVIRKNQKSKDVFKQCNFSTELNRDSLQINTVIRNGKYSDKKKPIGVLHDKINNSRDEFIKLLKQFSKDDISFVIYRRSDRPRPGHDVWTKLANISLEIINEELVDYIDSLLRSIKFPGIHICKQIPRGSKLLKDPEQLIKEGQNTIIKMKRILDFLNENK